MQYDPDFIFNFKPPDGGKYHQFPGLMYRATGWLKSEGKTESECAGLCDAGVFFVHIYMTACPYESL